MSTSKEPRYGIVSLPDRSLSPHEMRIADLSIVFSGGAARLVERPDDWRQIDSIFARFDTVEEAEAHLLLATKAYDESLRVLTAATSAIQSAITSLQAARLEAFEAHKQAFLRVLQKVTDETA